MGGKCACCGYDKCQSALELHHINPNEKSFTISEHCNWGWEKIKNEIKKCVLICANCHREIHAGLINTNDLQSNFNIERSLEIDKLNEKNQKHQPTCNNCGALITSKSKGLCENCAHLQARIAIRPDRNELKYMIRTIPFVQIAQKYNVSDNAIRKWCKSMNLPSKKTEIKSYSEEEWQFI